MALIVSYNASSCGVCWRVWLLLETGVEWVWPLRGGMNGVCVSIHVQCNSYRNCCLLFFLLTGYFSDCVASLELTCLFSSASKHTTQSIQ